MQELIEWLREAAESKVGGTAMINADDLLKTAEILKSQAAEIEKYKALCDQMKNALSSLNRFASQQICEHTETYRGGTMLEICRQCGAKWADDEGGKPNFVEPVVITNAIAALEAWRAMK